MSSQTQSARIILARSLVLLFLSAWAGVAQAQAVDDGALQKLRDSAQAISDTKNLSCTFTATVKVVMGDREQNSSAEYLYSKREDGHFFFRPNSEVMRENQDGVLVAGNGVATLTHILSLERHVIEESNNGITSFIQSPLSRGIGNGMGGLALSLLSSEATENILNDITDSKDLGEEDVDGVMLHHYRYLFGQDLNVDVWFSTEGAARPVRIQPDLSAMTAGDPAAQQFENFEYSLTFDYGGWSDKALDDSQYAIDEPAESSLVLSFFDRGQDSPHPLLGEAAPTFAVKGPNEEEASAVEFKTLDGEAVNLADHIGKDVVLLDFWATWCPPCIAAMPRINKVAQSFAEQGVVFYAVNQQEPADQVAEFLESRGLEPPVLLDEGPLGNSYLVESLPTTVLIGKDGRIQVVHIGFGSSLEQMLTQEIESLIAGEDLAAAILAQHESKKERDALEFERLRGLLKN